MKILNQVTSTSAPGTVNDGGGFWHAVKTWPLRGFFALLDQGLISGSNFILAILLARWVSPQQYGAYALAFEVLLFMSIVYGALILEPMCVFGPSTYKNDFRAYLGILLRIHCGLSVLVIAAVFGGRRGSARNQTGKLPFLMRLSAWAWRVLVYFSSGWPAGVSTFTFCRGKRLWGRAPLLGHSTGRRHRRV